MALMALLLLSVNTAFAQHLWRNVAYGASPAEVLRLVPGSRPSTQGTASVDGKQAAVVLDSYPFAGKTFEVGFLFASNRLAQVRLTDTVSMTDNEATRAAFERVSEALRRLYGQETTRKLESRPAGLFGGAEWAQARSRITLSVVPVTAQHSFIVVNFFELK